MALPQAYGTPCPRCGLPMLPGQRLDFGHSQDDALHPGSKADRMEHADYADCPKGGNRAAGGKLGAILKRRNPSRAWHGG